MMIQKWKDSTPRAVHQQQADWWTCMQSNMDTQSCALMQKMRTFTLRKTRMSTVGHRKNGCRGTTPEVDEWRRRKAAKKFNEFVVTATDGLGIEHVPSSHRSSGDQEPH